MKHRLRFILVSRNGECRDVTYSQWRLYMLSALGFRALRKFWLAEGRPVSMYVSPTDFS